MKDKGKEIEEEKEDEKKRERKMVEAQKRKWKLIVGWNTGLWLFSVCSSLPDEASS